MGTRSRIGVMHGNKVKSVYCHWNGSVEHTGAVLQEYYDSGLANHLVALGDMSTLGKAIGEAHPFSPHVLENSEFKALSPEEQDRIKAETSAAYEAAKKAGWCTFYGRDRGEKNTEFRVAQTFEQFLEQCDNCAAEYYYIMRDGEWYCGTTYQNTHPLSRTLTVLTESLTTQKEVA